MSSCIVVAINVFEVNEKAESLALSDQQQIRVARQNKRDEIEREVSQVLNGSDFGRDNGYHEGEEKQESVQ